MKASKPCSYCGKHSKDGGLCGSCVNSTKIALARVAELWPILEETIFRRDRLAAASEIRAETIYGPMPFKVAASDVAANVRTRIVGWVRILVEDFGAEYPPDRIPAMCGLISGYSSRLRLYSEADTWADEIASSRDEILAVIDLPAERSRVKVGPCPDRTEDGEPCPGTMFAIYPGATNLRPYLECRRPDPLTFVCGRVWTPETWAHMGSRIAARRKLLADQLTRGKRLVPDLEPATPILSTINWEGGRGFVSIGDASVTYGIPLSTLYRWADLGKLTKYKMGTTVLVDPIEVAGRAGSMKLDKTEKGAR